MTMTGTETTSARGWGVLAGLTVVLGVIFGTTFSSASIFSTSITETFGCTFEETGRSLAVFLAMMTVATPIAGWLIDRIGPRWVMTAGALLTALGYFIAFESGSITELVVALGIAGIGVGASTYVPSFTLATHWIAPHQQGLAFGILLAGSSAGSIVFPMVLTNVMADHGWRGGMLLIAATIVVFCVPLLLWLARMPKDSNAAGQQAAMEDAGPGPAAALRRPRYWIWIGVLTLVTLSLLCMYVAFVPYLVSIGYSPEQAAAFYAVSSGAGLVGNLAFGALSNRWGAKSVLILGSVITALGILLLLLAHDPVYGWFAVAVFSLAWGSTSNLVNQLSPILLIETMGDDRNFGSLFGIGNLVSGIGSAVSPEIVGHLVDTRHTYNSTIWLCTVLTLIALPAIPWLREARAEEKESHGEITSTT